MLRPRPRLGGARSKGNGGRVSAGPEWEQVERPLLEHLFSLGWETLVWSERQADGVDFRSSDRDVLLERRLGSALEKINRGPDGKPWLDEARIGSAVAELRSMPAGAKLLEANRLSAELLRRRLCRHVLRLPQEAGRRGSAVRGRQRGRRARSKAPHRRGV